MLVFPQEIEDGNKRKEVKELTISSDLYRKLGMETDLELCTNQVTCFKKKLNKVEKSSE